MNWDAIGAIGEIVGALAVFISLIYLAFQIRAQNREARISASHEITEAFREVVSSLQDEQLAELITFSINTPKELNDVQQMQLNAVASRYHRVWEEAHYQYTENRLEHEMWAAMEAQYVDIMGFDAIRSYWNNRKHAHRKSFRAYVDTLEFKEYRIR